MARIAVAGVPLLLVPALGAVQGGFQPDAWVWAGALAAWAAALGLAVTDRTGALRHAWLWPVSGAALLLWTTASRVWSAAPAQTLLEARRTVVYAAVVLALAVLIRRGSSWLIVTATHLAVSALVVYALLRYLLGPRVHETFEGHLISQPLGYANAVGILAVLGVLLALAPASDGHSPAHRGLAAATVPLLTLALAFSGSKASWLSLAFGLATIAVLASSPRRVARTAVTLAIPSAVLVWVAHASRLTHDGTPRIGGAVVVAIAAVTAVAGAVALVVDDRTREAGRGLPHRLAAVAAPAILVLGAIAVFVAAATTEPRRSYFAVAWHELSAHPLLGSGAGTFGHYWLGSTHYIQYGGALDAHGLYLETLAELGPLGLLLLLTFLLYPLRFAVTCRGEPGVPAAAGAAIAFLVHAGVDWDWELPAVVVAGLCCLAALVAAADRVDEGAPRLARLAALACAVILGLAAIAGTASSTEPSAAQTFEAP